MSERADHQLVLKGLAPYVWPDDRPDLKIRVVLAFVALVVAKIITILVPLFYKASVDWLSGQEHPGESVDLSTLSLTMVPIFLIISYGVGRILMIGFNQLRDVLFTRVGQNAVRSLARRTFEHLHKLSLRFHLERRTGGLNRVIERGVKAVELIIRMGVLNTVPTLLEFLFVILLLAYYFGWSFVFIVLMTICFYIWFTVVASDWRIAIRRELNDSDTEANSKAVDSLLNYETIKYFGNEGLETRRFDQSMARYEQAAIKTYSSLGVLNAGQTAIYTTGLTLCMLLSARGVVRGEFTIGDFVMVNAILIQLSQPLFFIGMVYREIRQGLVDLENMFALISKSPEIEDAPGAQDLKVSQGVIRFENVSFSYDKERPILENISFEVPGGKVVAIVGPSGAGKSTISRILFRFYDVSAGRVLIDDQNIYDVTQTSLRAAIGMVPQDTVLFNDTIYYNILYGRPEALEEEVYEAARLAQIDDFIQTLPEGYQAMVGERGLKLSGGEKQRVAIARMLLKAPPILMLDEATSALDSHTEKEIQDALNHASKNRTTLVIAHRLSTIIHADEILVFDAGKIVERGHHVELISNDGLYASMWARQKEAEEARETLAHAIDEGIIAEPSDFLPVK